MPLKNKLASIQLLKQLAERRAKTTAMRLAASREQLQTMRNRHRDLQGFQREYVSGEQTMGCDGISAKRLADLQAFRRQLSAVLDNGEVLLTQAVNEHSAARELWLVQHRRARALSDLAEMLRRRQRQKDDAREQSVEDENSRNAHLARGR